MKERYYKLVRIVKEQGTPSPKKHGEYRTLLVFGDWSLQLDTWNNAIAAYKGSIYRGQIGIDWGGFQCNEFWTNFWLSHLTRYA